MKNVFITVVITLLYIFLLTMIFEYCINQASNTMLTLAGVAAFLVISFVYANFVINQFKNRIK